MKMCGTVGEKGDGVEVREMMREESAAFSFLLSGRKLKHGGASVVLHGISGRE